jgi:hypothetical protein
LRGVISLSDARRELIAWASRLENKNFEWWEIFRGMAVTVTTNTNLVPRTLAIPSSRRFSTPKRSLSTAHKLQTAEGPGG